MCGGLKYGNDEVFNFDTLYNQINTLGLDNPDIPFDIFEIAGDDCLKNVAKKTQKKIINLFENRTNNIQETIYDMFQQNMNDFMTKCSGVLSLGYWKCSRQFKKIFTRNGLCMTFNMLNDKDLIRDET